MQKRAEKGKLEFTTPLKVVAILLSVFLAGLSLFHLAFWNKIYPGIYVAGIYLGGKTKSQAIVLLKTRLQIGPTELTVMSGEQTFALTTDEISFTTDRVSTTEKAFSIGRKKNFFENYKEIWQALKDGINLSSTYSLNETALTKFIDGLAAGIEQSPQNATFRFDPSAHSASSGQAGSGRVIEFTPATDGLAVEKDKLKERIIGKLTAIGEGQEIETIVVIPVVVISPEITTNSVNKLGIKELVGRGSSHFRGSSPSRVHNIRLASQRLNGILIPPGEIFSFNSGVGDVSSLTGYQQAYVIDKGKIVLGDGGGVCQVSTTFFRAALNAGLPITERRAHSYRVSYYEQDSSPGIDATVYTPSPDLKIKNDTPAHILIQTNLDPKTTTLAFEFYGTSDGRVATITKPQISSTTPAPEEDIYQDDPTLQIGTTKQVNPRVGGAKVSFGYKVTRGGEILQNKSFYSIYRPWQGLYLRGTGGQ